MDYRNRIRRLRKFCSSLLVSTFFLGFAGISPAQASEVVRITIIGADGKPVTGEKVSYGANGNSLADLTDANGSVVFPVIGEYGTARAGCSDLLDTDFYISQINPSGSSEFVLRESVQITKVVTFVDAEDRPLINVDGPSGFWFSSPVRVNVTSGRSYKENAATVNESSCLPIGTWEGGTYAYKVLSGVGVNSPFYVTYATRQGQINEELMSVDGIAALPMATYLIPVSSVYEGQVGTSARMEAVFNYFPTVPRDAYFYCGASTTMSGGGGQVTRGVAQYDAETGIATFTTKVQATPMVCYIQMGVYSSTPITLQPSGATSSTTGSVSRLQGHGPDDGEFSAWTKVLANGTQMKFYAKYLQPGQKVQFMVQNSSGVYEQVAWKRVTESDLTSDGAYSNLQNYVYFIRTVDLKPGKNRVRILVDGEIVWGTKTYSLK